MHGPRLKAPLEQSLASAATTYQVLFFRNWDEAGFVQLRGLPTVGMCGTTVVEREPYLHHPVLSYWLMYASRRLLGWNETAFRLVPALATVLASALTVLLVARLAGLTNGLMAGVLYPLLPLVFAFGCMPNPEALVVLFLLGGVLLHLRFKERPEPGRRRWLMLWFLVGCQVDWQVYFLPPALLVAELLTPREQRTVAEPLRLIPVGAVAFLLTLSHFALGVGSVPRVVEDLMATAGATIEGGEERSLAGFFSNQLGVWRRFLGWPCLAIVAGLGVAVLLRPARVRSLPARTLAALALPVLLNLAVFPTPAYDHDFYWMPGAVFVPAAVMVAERSLRQKWPLLAALLLAGVFGTSVWLDITHDQETAADPDYYPRIAAILGTFLEEDDVVLTPETVGPASFYLRARLYEGIDRPRMVEELWNRTPALRRLHLFMSDEKAALLPELVSWLESYGRPLAHPGVRAWVIER